MASVDSWLLSIFKVTIGYEGGYNPCDSNGHEAYCGINRQWSDSSINSSAETWEGWAIIDDSHLKANETIDSDEIHDLVIDWYYNKYYLYYKCDSLECVDLVGQYFDFCFTRGNKACRELRKAINEAVPGASVDENSKIIDSQAISYCNNESYMSLIASKYIERRRSYYTSDTDYWDERITAMLTTTGSL